MRIKQEASIHNAANIDDEELHHAGAMIVKSSTYRDMEAKLRAGVIMIVDEKRRQLLIDNLNKNGIHVQ